MRNRYWNVLPYDNNRVVLESSAETPLAKNEDGYINASWITQRIADLDMTNIYIAAQVLSILSSNIVFPGAKEGDCE